jgi:predicted transcriptional regulator
METDNAVELSAQSSSQSRGAGPRHSILDLAPLELECLSVLWPIGESTVRDIHRSLAVSRPRAYTTVLTIMDRLAQKGIVTRRKVGRAFLYQARLSAEEARLQAVRKIVEGFFDGSPEALAAHLSSLGSQLPAEPSRRFHELPSEHESSNRELRRPAARTGRMPEPAPGFVPELVPEFGTEPAAETAAKREAEPVPAPPVDVPATSAAELQSPNLDERLL